ncbi:MAG: glycine cleavage system protein GcvH [Pseudomonadota bacterium]
MTTYYTEDHEWITVEGEVATIGVTEHAAEQLGEVVFIELKEAGDTFGKGDEIGVIETVKAASEVYAPVDGEIVEANSSLSDAPTELNEHPEGSAWLYKIKINDSGQLNGLMDKEAYNSLIG